MNMELHMKEKTTCRDIQDEFSLSYPFLKIDFFKNIRDRLGWTIKAEKILSEENFLPHYRLGSIHLVNINHEKTISELKKEMEEILLLRVMFLRKSGNVWIETSLTKDWTLEQQNREGKYMSIE
jgi:hypothetical protein